MSYDLSETKERVHTPQTVSTAAAQVPLTFVRLNARRQRELFGAAVFGKRTVRRNVFGGFVVRRRVGFGQDFDDQYWSYAEIAVLLNANQTVVGKKD